MRIKQLLKEYYANGGELTEFEIGKRIFKEKDTKWSKILFSYLKNEHYHRVNLKPDHMRRLCEVFCCEFNDLFKRKYETSDSNKSGIVQTKNPRTGKYIKIDRDKGKILETKESTGPYKGVPII